MIILGKKQYMTQYFTEDGKAHAATVVLATPSTVTAVKTTEKDGYSALQLGFETQKKERVSKAVQGQMGDLGVFKTVKEFASINGQTPVDLDKKRGDVFDVSGFTVGDVVRVTGVSKGKGFQGVVKRHGFHGGPRTHGQKHSEREPGSIGGGLRARVPKGMRMAGRTGSDTITVANLRVLDVDMERNLLVLSGALPGRRGTLLKIMTTKTK